MVGPQALASGAPAQPGRAINLLRSRRAADDACGPLASVASSLPQIEKAQAEIET